MRLRYASTVFGDRCKRAAAGVGIAFLPRVLAERRPHLLVRFALLDEPKCKWRIALAWRRGGYLPHAACAWLAHAREEHAKTG